MPEISNLRQSLAKKESLAASAFANSIIRHERRINDSIKVKSNELNKDELNLYMPLINGIDKTSIMALLCNSIMVIRRMILLYVAMFEEDDPLIQVLCF